MYLPILLCSECTYPHILYIFLLLFYIFFYQANPITNLIHCLQECEQKQNPKKKRGRRNKVPTACFFNVKLSRDLLYFSIQIRQLGSVGVKLLLGVAETTRACRSLPNDGRHIVCSFDLNTTVCTTMH